jgi:p-aminobenzoyl-glutamate transporter AbgT
MRFHAADRTLRAANANREGAKSAKENAKKKQDLLLRVCLRVLSAFAVELHRTAGYSPFASVAAGFALFAADFSAAPWLGHAVSFPFGCTENIHPTPKRLANAHSGPKGGVIGTQYFSMVTVFSLVVLARQWLC